MDKRSASLEAILNTEHFRFDSAKWVDGSSDVTGTLLFKLYNVKTDDDLKEFNKKFDILSMGNNYGDFVANWHSKNNYWPEDAFGLTKVELDAFEHLCDHTYDPSNRAKAVKEYAKTLSAHTARQSNTDASEVG